MKHNLDIYLKGIKNIGKRIRKEAPIGRRALNRILTVVSLVTGLDEYKEQLRWRFIVIGI